MSNKTLKPNPAIVLSRYPTIPTIDWVDVERAQVRGRELHADAVRAAFSGLFRALFGLPRGGRRGSGDGRCRAPLATSNTC